jgi:hypothetical protein
MSFRAQREIFRCHRIENCGFLPMVEMTDSLITTAFCKAIGVEIYAVPMPKSISCEEVIETPGALSKPGCLLRRPVRTADSSALRKNQKSESLNSGESRLEKSLGRFGREGKRDRRGITAGRLR